MIDIEAVIKENEILKRQNELLKLDNKFLETQNDLLWREVSKIRSGIMPDTFTLKDGKLK